MAEPKTKPTTASVSAFLGRIANEERRKDCQTVVRLMKQATKAQPKMWGPSIVGFGRWTLTYADGRTSDWPLAAFSPRKTDLTLYIDPDLPGRAGLIAKLGKSKQGKTCVYIKRLADVDMPTLRELITRSVKHVKTSGC